MELLLVKTKHQQVYGLLPLSLQQLTVLHRIYGQLHGLQVILTMQTLELFYRY